VRADFGKCEIVRFRFAALAAFLIFRFAAAFCLLLAIIISMTLEILHCTFVRLRLLPRREGSKIAPLARLGIFLLGVQSIVSRFKFPNHAS